MGNTGGLSPLWGIILKPQPPHTGQNMNNNLATKLSSLPCFEAISVIFCPNSVHSFALCVWGAGVTHAFLTSIVLFAKTAEERLKEESKIWLATARSLYGGRPERG